MPKQNEDPENPEWTAEMVARARRGIAHLPASVREAIENTRRGRGPQKEPTKVQVTLRLSRPVLAAYKRTGPGWQSRINADLEHTASTMMATRTRRAVGRKGSAIGGRTRKTAAKKLYRR